MENFIMKFKPTRLAYFKWYLAAFILFIIWVMLFFNLVRIEFLGSSGYLFLLLVIGLILVIISELMIISHRYYISNYRIVEKNGLLSIHETSVRFDKIANYTVKQNLVDRLLDIGTVLIESVGGDEPCEITMREVRHIKKIKKLIEDLIIKK